MTWSSRTRARLLLATGLLLSCAAGQTRGAGDEPIVGGPCEGCEAIFDGLPEGLDWHARIAPEGEPGEALRIEGRVVDGDGTPAPGTIVYAYQTDAAGIYPLDPRSRGRAGYRHGTLRGWARADVEGRYRFDTVRPGGYPDSDMPQHIHMHVLELGCCTYYVDDVVFRDDPRLTPAKIRQYARGRGGSGVVTPERDGQGRWTVRRDVILGERIPGYPS